MIDRLRRAFERYERGPLAVRVGLVLVWIGFLWWHSGRVPPTARFIPGSFLKNFAHAVAFGLLAVLILATMRAGFRFRWLVAVVLAAAYGILDEVHQSWIPERDASVWDAASDGLGAAWSCVAVAWITRPTARAVRALIGLAFAILGSVSLATWA